MDISLHLCGKRLNNFRKSTKLVEIAEYLQREHGLDRSDLYFICNGKVVDKEDDIKSHIYAEIRCYGGKGGFGSMLRAIGAQIEKTTNREACRDLSGRRLRDINEEKRLKDWLEKQKEREAESEAKRRKKLEKLLAVPKHDFKDTEYESARSDLTEKVSEAVEVGLKRALNSGVPTTSQAAKRKIAQNERSWKRKKATLWIDEELSSTESEGNDSEDECKAPVSLNQLKNSDEETGIGHQTVKSAETQ